MITPEDHLKESLSSMDEFVETSNNSSTEASDIEEELGNEELSEDEEDLEDLEDEGVLEDPSKGRRRSRTTRTYPASSFIDALEIGAAIHEHAGTKIRRLTLLEKLGRSPTSGTTRQMITTSGKYGITKGSYNAEHLELAPEGQIIFDSSKSPRHILQAKFTLAVEQIPPFKKLYDEYVGKRLPAPEVMRDFLKDSGEKIDDFKECIDLFIVNVKDVELLRTIGGAETLIPIEQALEELPSQYVERNSQPVVSQKIEPTSISAHIPQVMTLG
jgi:hypothetical protein